MGGPERLPGILLARVSFISLTLKVCTRVAIFRHLASHACIYESNP